MTAVMNLRAKVAEVLHTLRQGKGITMDLLPELDRQLPDTRDRALARAMLYACLRGIDRYERWLGELLERPLPKGARVVESVLLLAFASLHQRIDAEHATVSASVDAVRALNQAGLAGLTNAVLRRAQREHQRLVGLKPRSLAEAHNHPGWLVDRLVHDWGDEQAVAILTANNEPAPLWLRVNRRRLSAAEWLDGFERTGGVGRRVAELPDAVVLDESTDVTSLPGFTTGDVSVQDGAAQLAPLLLDLADGQCVLDACAAPGGKLAHIAEHGHTLKRLLACDVSKNRLKRMEHTLDRLDLAGSIEWRQADAGDARAFTEDDRFDRILLDAPCTGTGVIRRHPDIRLARRAEQVIELKRTQARLLDRMFALLAPGGRLVYATCSVLAEENAAQVAAFLTRQPNARLLPVVPEWFGRDTGYGRQVFPGELGFDGFFYAVLARA